jgi:tetratricopeptide (TPR) repeat protein
MRKQLIKGLFYTLVCISAGCSKELNTVPTESVDANTALNTSDDVKAALIGAYTDFGSSYWYGGRIFLEADLMANQGDLYWGGTYQQLTQINNKTIPVDNSYVANNWLAAYTAINDVNNILGRIQVVNASDSASVGGQAKFIRGASYFELVKMYAKDWNSGDPTQNSGVPLVLTPTTVITEQSKVKRNSVAEVYDQVIRDLNEAEASLPTSNGFYATKASAAAILARVYLQQADYANALQVANRAINESGAKLTPTYAEAFGTSNTSEDIFAVQVTTTSGTQGLNEFYSSAQRGDVTISDQFLNQFEPGDDRRNLFETNSGSTYSLKFNDLYGNVHTIRLAEMLLIRAECNFRLGTSVGATPLADVNAIRNRAGLRSLKPEELTLNAILKERRLELAFEGFSLDDIKRLKQSVGNLPWNSAKLIFPIPKREIVANPNLTQNEGYF